MPPGWLCQCNRSLGMEEQDLTSVPDSNIADDDAFFGLENTVVILVGQVKV